MLTSTNFRIALIVALMAAWIHQYGGRPSANRGDIVLNPPPPPQPTVRLEWEHPEDVTWKITIDEVGVTPQVTRTTGETYQMNLPTLRSGFHKVKIAACNGGVCSEPSSVRFELTGDRVVHWNDGR